MLKGSVPAHTAVSPTQGRSSFDIQIPFVEHLGLQLLEKGDGRVLVRLDPRPEHLNSWNGVHGGVLMTLLDVALSSAARSLDAACIGATTVEMKANFLTAAAGSIFAEGFAQRAGRSLIYSEGEVRDPAGTVLAKASGTFKLIYPQSNEQ
jgi:uncharacterized protein (TIGR00369 family)